MILPLYIPGHWELLIVVIAVIILFGGKKIPEMMRGIGSGIKEFKKGIREGDEEEKKITDKDPSDSEKKS
jgi:sec-independent protein translocase protein TatA